ncbi:hypothetical protein [Streptomyces sp. SP18CS02]|uniref:hypothetical protein n=1 Tax=Streptomyces sp. SP18CS02 TaxID=3002531 RepID=UPI002E7A2F7A|nr:hypothetical protein [Streptomyces sp. SP18CS02]MEE1755916.1 hypothetical protein [Streptomyces sp. SP18CS02]
MVRELRKLAAAAADVLVRVMPEDGWQAVRTRLVDTGGMELVALDYFRHKLVENGDRMVPAQLLDWLESYLPRAPKPVLDEFRALAEGSGAPGAPGGTSNTVVGGVASAVVQSGSIGVLNQYTATPDPAAWLPVSGTGPVDLGARNEGAYVRRDRDADLERLTGLVLVTGEPLTGKTTTAWAAMSARLPRHQVCVPPPGSDLRYLPERIRHRGGPCVLWLDELEGHLHDRGLDAGLLSRLTAMDVPVLATMTDRMYRAHRFGTTAHARLLSRARIVELARVWSEDETRRLAESEDPRLQDALEWRGGHGVTEFLALGPELWDEWQWARRPSDHPRGHLLVRAAIDLARCGVTGPVPLSMLRATYDLYGTDEAAAADESFEDALDWASRPRLGLAGLLVAGRAEGTWQAHGSLVGNARRRSEVPAVTPAVWAHVLRTASTDPSYDLHAVAAAARAQYLPPAEDGDPDAMFRIGMLAERVDGDLAAAERWYRPAAGKGSRAAAGALGRLLAGRGMAREAEFHLETAAGAGDAKAALLLGKLLRDRAEEALRQAAGEGNAEAAHHLGDLLFGRGEDEAAFDWYVTAADAGYEKVAGSLGGLHRYRAEEGVAAVWIGRAIDAGDTVRSAAPHPNRARSDEETTAYFRDAADEGARLDPANLGVLLEEQGRHDEARAWYEEGFRRGDSYGAFRLAGLDAKEGRTAGAAHWMRRAADAGHPGALGMLGAQDGPTGADTSAEDAPGADTVEG